MFGSSTRTVSPNRPAPAPLAGSAMLPRSAGGRWPSSWPWSASSSAVLAVLVKVEAVYRFGVPLGSVNRGVGRLRFRLAVFLVLQYAALCLSVHRFPFFPLSRRYLGTIRIRWRSEKPVSKRKVKKSMSPSPSRSQSKSLRCSMPTTFPSWNPKLIACTSRSASGYVDASASTFRRGRNRVRACPFSLKVREYGRPVVGVTP